MIEEEKFRKNGKKKYESLSEKLISAALALQSAAGGLKGSVTIEMTPILSSLSSQGQSLIRGGLHGHTSTKVHERLELMHLHTTTHGTRRWSGDKEEMEKAAMEIGGSVDEADAGSLTPISNPASKAKTTARTQNILSPTGPSRMRQPVQHSNLNSSQLLKAQHGGTGSSTSLTKERSLKQSTTAAVDENGKRIV